ncbi:hypothetical protein BDN70DRAFT_975475 [Pholiota conissans]|uniref:F-box domain-containing protein n=1 Tax=Pholiota conissans TaxID=109636 RepID=A0A9P5Z539_9AGAR|nr:hypothetical protein BDN70DRAFT_975475 [Pholiota conissans]
MNFNAKVPPTLLQFQLRGHNPRYTSFLVDFCHLFLILDIDLLAAQMSYYKHPTDHCPNLAKGGLCPACKELIKLEEEIIAAEDYVDALKKRLQGVYSRMNAAHDPVSSKLPVEITSAIFANMMDDPVDESSPGPVEMASKNISPIPFLLGSICTAWRNVAWSTPQLWATISIDIEQITRHILRLLTGWLERSGSLPLRIGIYHPDHSDNLNRSILTKIFNILQKHRSRWLYLELVGIALHSYPSLCADIPKASILETLKIIECVERSPLSLGGVENLKTLTARSTEVVNIKWSVLTHLEISFRSLDAFFEMISLATSLKHCTFSFLNRSGDDDEFIGPFNPLVLRHEQLVYLELLHWTMAQDVVLSRLQLPSLQHLLGRWDELSSVLELVSRSSCELKSLQICPQIKNLEGEIGLVTFLEQLPTLESFTIYGDLVYRPIDALLRRLSSTAGIRKTTSMHRVFLPNLGDLTIKIAMFSWAYILGLLFEHSVGSRAPEIGEDNDIRPFRTLTIELDGGLTPSCFPEMSIIHKLYKLHQTSMLSITVVYLRTKKMCFKGFLELAMDD